MAVQGLIPARMSKHGYHIPTSSSSDDGEELIIDVDEEVGSTDYEDVYINPGAFYIIDFYYCKLMFPDSLCAPVYWTRIFAPYSHC